MEFQYRKRYGLHAILRFLIENSRTFGCFNTASGMDCMQLGMIYPNMPLRKVSIPQAVWIACNAFERDADSGVEEFQYRKRYGLHAIFIGVFF